MASSPLPLVGIPRHNRPNPRRWQTIGYPVYSQVVASDKALFLLRRFDNLNSRVILGLQDDLAVLENKLKTIDEFGQQSVAPVHNGSFRQDVNNERKLLLEEIKNKLSEYNEFVIAHSELKSRPLATQRQRTNLENWHYKNQGAILPGETEYINNKSDLITITPIIKTPLLRALERTRWISTASIFRRHSIELLPSAYDKNTMYYSSDEKLQVFDTVLVMAGGLAMLLAPIWILNALTSNNAQLGTISAFIVLFVVLVQAVTTAKPYETLAAVAAYSAVLMVFIQRTQSNSG